MWLRALRRTDGAILWARRECIPVGRLRPKFTDEFCVLKLMGKKTKRVGCKMPLT